MPDPASIRETLAEIEADLRRMLSPDAVPYDLAIGIWSKAMAQTPASPDIMHPLWLIWGALTDWVERRPEERSQAEATMMRAASEWLATNPDDLAGRSAYLDRWVYDEMGYERTTASASLCPTAAMLGVMDDPTGGRGLG